MNKFILNSALGIVMFGAAHCGIEHAYADAPYGLCIREEIAPGYYLAFTGANTPTGEFDIQGFKFTDIEARPQVGDCGRADAFPDHTSREHVGRLHGQHFHNVLSWEPATLDAAMLGPEGAFTYCDAADSAQCGTNSTPLPQGGNDWMPVASHGEGLDPSTEPIVEEEDQQCDYGLDSETKCLDGRTDSEPAGGTD
jgi:hypothetical protein